MSRVFISYRRGDCMQEARALYDGLTHRLPDWALFQDLDSIPPGADFEAEIRKEIGRCDVLLLMIGDNWLDADPDGTRRIDEENDFVRLEARAALERGVSILPVLVEGAEMPKPRELPEEVAGITRYNAHVLTDERWPQDVSELAKALPLIVERNVETAVDESSAKPTREPGGSLQLPSRVTERWLAANVPRMRRAELLELGGALLQRRWAPGDVIDLAFAYAREGEAPPSRGPRGRVRSRIRAKLPARITVSWLERSVPEMSGDSLATVVNELEQRGWSAGEIEDYVLALAKPDYVEPLEF